MAISFYVNPNSATSQWCYKQKWFYTGVLKQCSNISLLSFLYTIPLIVMGNIAMECITYKRAIILNLKTSTISFIFFTLLIILHDIWFLLMMDMLISTSFNHSFDKCHWWLLLPSFVLIPGNAKEDIVGLCRGLSSL